MAFFLGKQTQDKRLGVYVHIPFCKSKCEYCDFYSLPGACDQRTTDDYLQALADHIREAGQLSTEHLVDSVYFGGGTPSYFGAENLEKFSTSCSAPSASASMRRSRSRRTPRA